jgi:hypothetical protein
MTLVWFPVALTCFAKHGSPLWKTLISSNFKRFIATWQRDVRTMIVSTFRFMVVTMECMFCQTASSTKLHDTLKVSENISVLRMLQNKFKCTCQTFLFLCVVPTYFLQSSLHQISPLVLYPLPLHATSLPLIKRLSAFLNITATLLITLPSLWSPPQEFDNKQEGKSSIRC